MQPMQPCSHAAPLTLVEALTKSMAAKPAPLMVSSVPPSCEPLAGLMEATDWEYLEVVGGAGAAGVRAPLVQGCMCVLCRRCAAGVLAQAAELMAGRQACLHVQARLPAWPHVQARLPA